MKLQIFTERAIPFIKHTCIKLPAATKRLLEYNTDSVSVPTTIFIFRVLLLFIP